MDLVIFGANGPTGRLLVEDALAAGHHVRAVTRHPESLGMEHERLEVFAGDALDAASVAESVRGADAVLSTLGAPYGRKPISLYSVSARNLVDALGAQGIRRLVVVSSSATDPQERFRDTGGGFFFERVLKPVITNTMGKQLYADMLRMERIVRASGLDWTIVRPSGLFGTDAVTDYGASTDFIRGRYTSRRDLADFLLRQATDTDYVRKAVAVATFDPQPTVMQLIRNEALAK